MIPITMKTIFDKNTQEKLIVRIAGIDQTHQAHWGKMNIYQMLLHNTYWNEWILGKHGHEYKQTFMGKLVGKMVLRRMIKNEQPFDKNVPTSERFKPKSITCDLELEKLKWIALIKEYDSYQNPDFIHDFFGKMTKEEVGILVYKHTDHHLRQFGL